MADSTKPDAPKLLKARGAALWGAVTEAYSLRPDELAVLEAACRTADIVAQLDVELDGQPLTVKASHGGTREHPLLSEARLQRAQMARYLSQLKLPDVPRGAATNRHRKAAQSRWAQAHGSA